MEASPERPGMPLSQNEFSYHISNGFSSTRGCFKIMFGWWILRLWWRKWTFSRKVLTWHTIFQVLLNWGISPVLHGPITNSSSCYFFFFSHLLSITSMPGRICWVMGSPHGKSALKMLKFRSRMGAGRGWADLGSGWDKKCLLAQAPLELYFPHASELVFVFFVFFRGHTYSVWKFLG